ncbi:uncharacterized protein LOC135948354 [Cloeon dipterum]|uniref:uncharacterized protein LOC135948354 n=1 Tax=Cloeon dipterum TaxID=197152 RepID=UPI00322071CF
MTNTVWILMSMSLLSFFASAGSSKREKFLQLLKTLQDLGEKIKFADSEDIIIASFSTTAKTSNLPTRPTPPRVNFNKAVKYSGKDAERNRTYCNEALCPEITCKLSDIIALGSLRKSFPNPQIYRLSNSTKMYISTKKHGYYRSFESCCKYNSTLFSFTTDEVWSSFQVLLKMEKKKGNLPTIFWTSAMYAQECDSYVWCPEKELVGPQLKWRQGFPNRDFGDCVAIQTGVGKQEENGLFNFNCTTEINFMCLGSAEVVGN